MKKKCLLLFTLLLITPRTYSQEDTLLKCLAREEEYYHREKIQGGYYQLNQELMGKWLKINGVEVKSEKLKKICEQKPSGAALQFLIETLISKKSLFFFSNHLAVMQKRYQEVLLDQFLEEVPLLMVHFLAKLQLETPNAACFKEFYPGFREATEKLQFLLQNAPPEQLVSPQIAEHLKKIESTIKACEKKWPQAASPKS